jgi:hypothetical protein
MELEFGTGAAIAVPEKRLAAKIVAPAASRKVFIYVS